MSPLFASAATEDPLLRVIGNTYTYKEGKEKKELPVSLTFSKIENGVKGVHRSASMLYQRVIVSVRNATITVVSPTVSEIATSLVGDKKVLTFKYGNFGSGSYLNVKVTGVACSAIDSFEVIGFGEYDPTKGSAANFKIITKIPSPSGDCVYEIGRASNGGANLPTTLSVKVTLKDKNASFLNIFGTAVSYSGGDTSGGYVANTVIKGSFASIDLNAKTYKADFANACMDLSGDPDANSKAALFLAKYAYAYDYVRWMSQTNFSIPGGGEEVGSYYILDAALRSFQAQNGLTVTGSLDSATIQKIKSITCGSEVAKYDKKIVDMYIASGLQKFNSAKIYPITATDKELKEGANQVVSNANKFSLPTKTFSVASGALLDLPVMLIRGWGWQEGPTLNIKASFDAKNVAVKATSTSFVPNKELNLALETLNLGPVSGLINAIYKSLSFENKTSKVQVVNFEVGQAGDNAPKLKFDVSVAAPGATVVPVATTTPTNQAQKKAVITSIESAANPKGTITVNEKAMIRGTGLSGTLTVKLGNQEPQTVTVTGVSDTYAEFDVPYRQQAAAVSVTVTNASGMASNAYQVKITVPQTGGGTGTVATSTPSTPTTPTTPTPVVTTPVVTTPVVPTTPTTPVSSTSKCYVRLTVKSNWYPTNCASNLYKVVKNPDLKKEEPASGSPISSVVSSMCVNLSKNTGIKSQGVEVSMLQAFLKAEGYLSSDATGYFGSMTKAAVIKYQVEKNISPAEGYVGSMTRGSIKGESCNAI